MTSDNRPTPNLPTSSALIAGLADGTLAIGTLAGFEVAAVVGELVRRNAVLEASNDRMADLIANPESIRLEIERATIAGEIQGIGVRILAASFAEMLGDSPNCVEVEVAHETVGAMVVTVGRKWGKTPLQLRNEAEAERDALLRHCVVPGDPPWDTNWYAMLEPMALSEWERFDSETAAIEAIRKAVGISEQGKG